MKVSVCIAAWNGERHIATQLESILNQLGEHDEVIVVDDASTDGTRNCVRSLRDSRIRLIEHAANSGVQRTFEEAIRSASGDILFLSDQDDIWARNKVSIVLQAFQECPELDLAVSDAALIDEAGKPLADSYYSASGGFHSGVLVNLLHCKYLGCTMAFRRRVRDKILPFPAATTVFHDLWIGTATAVSGGKTIYIAQPLVYYRRHLSNVTGNRRLPFARQVRIRWDLCLALVQFCVRHRRRCSSLR